ncbi:MAG: hypothetical protein Q8P18_24485 [Pseudomonadota bacterium]|nr:hypothetical protein [Pseudomonadota bacterium]
MDVPSLGESILAPARLLVEQAGRWLPIVVALAMVSALPEIVVQTYLPEALSFAGGWTEIDVDFIIASAGTLAIMCGMKLVLELVAYMLVFVVLADLTAGRTPRLWSGLGRLASWRLQGAWIVAGFFEQTAIDLWFLGAALLLIPFGLVTVAAYEEASGFKAFPRSLKLGTMDMGPAKVGVRIAIAVTLGFAISLLLSALVWLVSFVTSAGGAASPLFSILSGTLPDGGFALPAFGWKDAAKTLLLSPLAMLPTVYMMATQQVVYWQARRHEEAGGVGNAR